MPVVYINQLKDFHRDAPSIAFYLAGYPDPYEAPESLQSSSEFRAWTFSLTEMSRVLIYNKVPDDCGVLIEYRLPLTSKRVDMILTGHDENGKGNFVVIELKQWSEVKPIKDQVGVVLANVARNLIRPTNHPSYQALSYSDYLSSMNPDVKKNHWNSYACAYMHNYMYKGIKEDPMAAPPNHELVVKAPIFGRFNARDFGNFLNTHIGCGKGKAILETLADGRIVPSKPLIDTVADLFSRSSPQYFTLLDEQHLAFQLILSEFEKAFKGKGKRTVIVEGGPGTGKSVVALSVLVKLLKKYSDSETKRNIRFVSPTTSFRTAMVEMLCSGKSNDRLEWVRTKAMVKNLFLGSSVFFDDGSLKPPMKNRYSALLCDEAHRLRSQQNRYRGKNQIEDIINASRLSVFFVDDNQALRPNDIGSKESIEAAAKKYSSAVSTIYLTAQFRCAGAQGFLNWLADVLHLSQSPTANNDGWDEEMYDFDIVDTPEEVVEFVRQKNASKKKFSMEGHSVINGARLLAGYAWPWTKEPDENGYLMNDITFPSGLSLPWNASYQSYNWATDPTRVDEVGCVHTSQGLEFEYVGVFIGPDLKFDPDKKELFADYDNYYDTGGKMNLGDTKAERTRNLLKYVCRCYRVLLSRGIRGARVYCCDKNLSKYLKSELKKVCHH